MGSFESLKRVSSDKKMNRAETLIAYEKSYMELLRRYKEEIQNIESMMQSLRAERLAFYNEQLPAIRQEMEMDEVSPEVRAQWMDEMQVNMEKSLKISEALIEHYVTKNLEEFKNDLQEAVGMV